MTARPRRWLALALAPIVATTILITPVAPAGAAPKDPPSADEGEANPTLSDLLDDTGRRFVQAKNAYDRSVKAQLGAAVRMREAEAQRDRLAPAAARVAAESYRTGSLSAVGFLLNSADSSAFMERAVSLNEMNVVNDQTLREYNAVVEKVAAEKAKIDRETAAQKQSVTAMASTKKAAEKAFALIGGDTVTKGFVVADSPDAKPAPRASDGDWPAESCNQRDPTTSGCVTARTLHMYKEVRKAGFKRFVGCHRNGGPFEHPKGRACDWSLQDRGFASYSSTRSDEFKYGNDLMAFLVRNADRLGILYVIWNRQIWFPTRGWSSYSGPSAHTDHVHVSML
ncbi:MAG TPA: hypothetical protein VF657_16310 [Actinoplanes sp.]|jgi:hypothetical protein